MKTKTQDAIKALDALQDQADSLFGTRPLPKGFFDGALMQIRALISN